MAVFSRTPESMCRCQKRLSAAGERIAVGQLCWSAVWGALGCIAQRTSWLARFDSTTATFGRSGAMGLWDVPKGESRPRSNTEVEMPKRVRWVATRLDAAPVPSRKCRLASAKDAWAGREGAGELGEWGSAILAGQRR